MTLPPELQVLTINATILAVAYLGIYPTLTDLTLRKLMLVDLVLTALALGVVGALFWGTGTRFSLLLFQTNWAVFALVTMMVMEYPLMRRLMRKHGMTFGGDEE
ncbi:MAG: hypothetical protein CFE34_14355 [Rhodobacteraceae bacterium PARR1]|nr:MAG: hypothetical protein CFE34_14355 [Rhodobacteraceae bacterium PARR1]